MPFNAYHIPALLVCFTSMLGSPWSLLSPSTSLSEFGFLPAIAQSRAAQPVMAVAQTRGAVIGLLTAIFYSRGQYADVDLILALYGSYAGVVDAYIVWKEGNRGKGVFRLVGSWLIAAAGLAGLTVKGGR
ncbi:hypothetical protein BR93DRAFT_520052 [Coniochaeta sp. PMI_546]|nr:hypothetical protein BR93DRAFT_520052 [Coniochaeta sp. PMI_546]